jgi:hypothetical protein
MIIIAACALRILILALTLSLIGIDIIWTRFVLLIVVVVAVILPESGRATGAATASQVASSVMIVK